MKKLFIILLVAFAGLATFSYANSLTNSNSSAVLLADNAGYSSVGNTAGQTQDGSRCTVYLYINKSNGRLYVKYNNDYYLAFNEDHTHKGNKYNYYAKAGTYYVFHFNY